ncbi:aminotransferase class I/II-fold pyridoxal phosphate-dependent enzyme [Ornithinibacillus massiliensis]|uniref:Aminotransferase class I/II-fold pyridoxal phosphate-dependent enzyme n=1 Tax=Ornithinibacillus massiliensis TaxID=1944633 RepID=A0ABS5M8K0_9BACI|nr:aminotransferase class I/II-fold pyridoxal phosphate-dependent enzyme [Ornithinibacillus massiliensis]MBS3678645.1 aminotransferase class I/II-fold pyridoxal phosphate-dependent enzyme [Ornithinibacillus massiliensis]
MNQQAMPLLEQLITFNKQNPLSFHVPGHKHGDILSKAAEPYFKSILPIDLTELSGLDDLHAPQGVINEAQRLAAEYFGADHTFFLVGGSTAGNLAMILATCAPGDKIIVQRNSHKSIMNGLELSGAKPILISPVFNEAVERFTAPSFRTVKEAILAHPDAKAIVLTYPDYFGKTYDLKEMIDFAHEHELPVLVDEAHGVHFSLGEPFPTSALALGADVVVQSAHKMAPAMTMASFLHVQSSYISKEQIAHYLQMIQSSSPSYPLMASLDMARHYLANLSGDEIQRVLESVQTLRNIWKKGKHWHIVESDDPLKITLQVRKGLSGFDLASVLEDYHVYPELATDTQVLLIHGIKGFDQFTRVEKIVNSMNEQYKYRTNHATIEVSTLFHEPMKELAVSYLDMYSLPKKKVPIEQAIGLIAAEAIIPYPPGIPVILKGERITEEQIRLIHHLIKQGATIQHQDMEQGIQVFG